MLKLMTFVVAIDIENYIELSNLHIKLENYNI
jgi:hypothetical protein